MSISIKTDILKEMVGMVVKGASNNKLVPLTSLICIKAESNNLTLITTDGINTAYVHKDGVVTGEELEVCVNVDIFSKLISKINKDTTEISLENNNLTISSNGTYHIELDTGSDGQPIKFPVDERLNKQGQDIKLSEQDIETICRTNKAAVSVTLDIPCYTGYYAGNGRIVTTDSYKMCGNNIKTFETPILLNPSMVNLLEIIKGNDITVSLLEDSSILIKSNGVTIVGKQLDGIESFAIDKIQPLLDGELSYTMEIEKQSFENVLDRISLFVGPFDENAIKLTFEEAGIKIESKASSGIEVVEKKSGDSVDRYCEINVNTLLDVVKACKGETILISYNQDGSCIKLKDGETIYLVSLNNLNK